MIREATGADIDRILALGESLRAESDFMCSVNPQKARRNLAFFINSKRCLVLVAEHQSQVVGFIVGGIETLWYSDEQLVTDVAFYVEPLYRAYGPALVKRLRSWGMRFPRVSELLLGISTGTRHAERTGRMYQHLGLRAVGGLYVQKLRGEHE